MWASRQWKYPFICVWMFLGKFFSRCFQSCNTLFWKRSGLMSRIVPQLQWCTTVALENGHFENTSCNVNSVIVAQYPWFALNTWQLTCAWTVRIGVETLFSKEGNRGFFNRWPKGVLREVANVGEISIYELENKRITCLYENFNRKISTPWDFPLTSDAHDCKTLQWLTSNVYSLWIIQRLVSSG